MVLQLFELDWMVSFGVHYLASMIDTNGHEQELVISFRHLPKPSWIKAELA